VTLPRRDEVSRLVRDRRGEDCGDDVDEVAGEQAVVGVPAGRRAPREFDRGVADRGLPWV
jgi:hypothetical protein